MATILGATWPQINPHSPECSIRQLQFRKPNWHQEALPFLAPNPEVTVTSVVKMLTEPLRMWWSSSVSCLPKQWETNIVTWGVVQTSWFHRQTLNFTFPHTNTEQQRETWGVLYFLWAPSHCYKQFFFFLTNLVFIICVTMQVSCALRTKYDGGSGSEDSQQSNAAALPLSGHSVSPTVLPANELYQLQISSASPSGYCLQYVPWIPILFSPLRQDLAL